MFSFTLPRFALTAALSVATLSAGIVISHDALSASTSSKESASQSLARKKKQLHRSKSMSARRAEDTATNKSSINSKHAQKLDKVRKGSVKVTQSAVTPGEAQYQAELREYEQKKRDYEKALAAYEARKQQLRTSQASPVKSKAMSASPAATLQSGSTSQALKPAAPAPATVASTNVSATEAAPAAKPNPFILNYVGSYEGSSLQTLGSPYTPNSDGTESDSPQVLSHLLTFGYRFSPNLSLSATPVLVTPLAGNSEATWSDPYLRLHAKNLYKQGNVQFNSDLRIYPGVTEASQKAGRLFRARNTQYLNVDLGKSFSFNWTSYIRASAYKTVGFENTKQGDDWKVMVNPALNYAFTDTLSGGIQWEGVTAHTFGEDPGFNSGSSGVIRLGIEWSPIANLWFNPMIGLPTGEGTRLLDGRSAQVLMDFQVTAF